MTGSADEQLDSISVLGHLLLDEEDLETTLHRVVDLACHSIDGCDMASVTLLQENRPSTVVFTSTAVPEIDAVQYQADAGPCLDAQRELRTTRYDATTAGERWPAFSRAATDGGIFSVIAFPLIVRGEGIGALNLYAEASDAFTAGDEALGEQFAGQASVTIANAQLYEAARDAMGQLEQALVSRDIIGTAKGILMSSRRLTAEQAFEALRQESQTRNVKLRDLADRVVYTGAMPEAPTR